MSSCLPRRIRRGLIEARSPASPISSSATPFPGEFAGASLKRGDGPDRARDAARLPRRIRRGLIEAGQTRMHCGSSSRAFPGEFAGASLKLRLRGVLSGGARAFPGEFAGASLKRGEVLDRLRQFSDLPRRIRRGLIEAAARSSRSLRVSCLPRRIRRGLIEASMRSAGSPAQCRPPSPANSPGPH